MVANSPHYSPYFKSTCPSEHNVKLFWHSKVHDALNDITMMPPWYYNRRTYMSLRSLNQGWTYMSIQSNKGVEQHQSHLWNNTSLLWVVCCIPSCVVYLVVCYIPSCIVYLVVCYIPSCVVYLVVCYIPSCVVYLGCVLYTQLCSIPGCVLYTQLYSIPGCVLYTKLCWINHLFITCTHRWG